MRSWIFIFVCGCGAAAGAPTPVGAEFYCFADRTPRASPRSTCARTERDCAGALGEARRDRPDDDFTACAARRGASCFVDQRRAEHCAVTDDDCEQQRKATDIMLLSCQER